MNAADYYYVSLGTVSWLILGVLAYGVWEGIKVIRRIGDVVEDVKDTTRDISMVKNSLKMGLLSMAAKFMEKKGKGGEEDDA